MTTITDNFLGIPACHPYVSDKWTFQPFVAYFQGASEMKTSRASGQPKMRLA